MKFALLVIILLYTPVNAQNIFVSKTGGSIPPYSSWETAANSISLAISAASNYDTIYIANGSYKENLLINTKLTLIGESSDSTIIDGRGLNDYTIDINENTNLYNLYIYGKEVNNNYNITAVYGGADSLVMINCIIDSISHVLAQNGNFLLQDCIIKNFNDAVGISDHREQRTAIIDNTIFLPRMNATCIRSGPHGNINITNCYFVPGSHNALHAVFTTGFEIKSLVFRNNIVNSIQGWSITPEYNVHDSLIVTNNTFCNQYGTTYYRYAAIYCRKNTNPVIKNNIFYNCYKGIWLLVTQLLLITSFGKMEQTLMVMLPFLTVL